MPYIDIETEKVDYRVILGPHHKRNKTNPGQMPKEGTALVLEGIYPNTKLFYREMIGTDPNFKLYSQVLEKAKESGIPIVGADPITNVKRFMEVAKKEDAMVPHLTLGKAIKIRAAIMIAEFMNGEINPSSWIYQAISEFAEAFSSIGFSAISLRNLSIAQRAWSFGQYQLTEGVSRPILALVVGTLHIGVGRTLRMSPQERVEAIRAHPMYGKYFNASDMRRIHYVQYDAEKSVWHTGQITDPYRV